MKQRTALTPCAIAAFLLSACSPNSTSGGTDDAATRVVTATVTSTAPVASTPDAQSTSAAALQNSGAAPAARATFKMPNEVGRVLQEAQDDIQRVSGNPVFFTSSTDALGAHRHQVLDSNWKVCSQNVAAGATVKQDALIDFAVVKLDETCP